VGELHRVIAQPGQGQYRVQTQVATVGALHLQRATECRQARATQHGLQAGQQLGHVEGFGEVVVGARIEALHTVVNAITRGEDEHRQGGQALAYPLQHGNAVHHRQAQVEHDTVKSGGLQQTLSLRAVASAAHAVACVYQLRAQAVAQQFIVFNNQ